MFPHHTFLMGSRNLASLMPPPQGTKYVYFDLSPVRVCAVQPSMVLLWDPSLPTDQFVHALCTRSLPGVVLGSWIVLRNVRVGRGLTITARSLVSPPPPLPIPLPPKQRRLVVAPPLYRNLKWRCEGCGRMNFPTKSCCYKCKRTHKFPMMEAPEPPPSEPTPPPRVLTKVFCDVPITHLADVISHKERNWKFRIAGRVVDFIPRAVRHFTHHGPYVVQLSVRDGMVTIPIFLCGKEAERFFFGLPPVDLFVNDATRVLLERRMGELRYGGVQEFGIQSYVPDGCDRRMYQLVDTIYLPQPSRWSFPS